jgi:hypothetical protein
MFSLWNFDCRASENLQLHARPDQNGDKRQGDDCARIRLCALPNLRALDDLH